MWPDGTHPMLFAESSCICVPSFRSIAPFYFRLKYHAHDVPLVTPILNVYGFMYLMLTN